MRHDPLVNVVISRFRQGWTPEEIAGRLPLDYPADQRMRVSHETLYSWVYSPSTAHRALWEYLPRGHTKRRKRGGRGVCSRQILWRIPLSRRPEDVNNRTTLGHGESDSIAGAGDTGGIHTSVERKSRFLCAVKISAITAENTFHAQHWVFSKLPGHAVAPVAADNGSEFAHHHKLADTLGVPTCFCDPYSSW